MAGVKYDLTGRLLALSVVPPQVEATTPAPPPSPDWSPLLVAARLDPAGLKPVAPKWTPPFHTDARAAWEGAWSRRPDVPIRVEAAAYRGRPVWFQVVNPWTRPEREASWAPTRGERATRSILIALLLGLVAVGAVLAKRNILMGRGDRRGAFRLGLALTGLGTASALLGAHHVAEPFLEILLLARCGSFALLVATLVWLFYLALEPYVRRLRPWTLVSWTRLLSGGFRDAVVGRDLLIGMVWGGAAALRLTSALARAPAGSACPGPRRSGCGRTRCSGRARWSRMCSRCRSTPPCSGSRCCCSIWCCASSRAANSPPASFWWRS